MRETKRRVESAAGIGLVLLSLGACRGSRAPEQDLERIPFTRAHGLVFVETRFASGPPLLALLDTGASASAIDPARSGDLPVLGAGEVVGTTGSLHVENVAVEGLRLGSIDLPILRATRRDLGGLLAPNGRVVEMILGSDALARFAVTIDFHANVIELSSASSGGASRGDARECVPMRLDNGIPMIPAALGGVETWLRVDTGASLFETQDVYVNVPAGLWEALQARNPGLKPTSQLQGTGANGETVALPVVRVEGARIGPKGLDSVFVIVQPSVGYFADPDAKGFVGNNFLEKLGRVTLDYAGGTFGTVEREGLRP